MTEPTNPTAQAAIDYAIQHNWRVFPVNPRTKAPTTPNGFKDAVTDPNIIIGWWPEPSTNLGIGVATGQRSGIFALDVDVKGSSNGKLSLERLEAEYGPLPATVTSETPSGGLHYLFRYPPSLDIRNSVEGVAEGLDIRGEGGYIVVPPTATASGGYTWVESPEQRDVADAPEWLLKLIIKHLKRHGSTTDLSTTESSRLIPEGKRNSTLKGISGRLRRSGLTPDEIYYTLAVINRRRCSPPLDNREVQAIAKGSRQYSASQDIELRAQAISATEDRLVGHLNSVLGPIQWPDDELIIQAVRAEDAGDSRMVVSLHKDQVLYYLPSKTWYVFDGLHWKAYPTETVRQVLVGRVAQVYAQTSAKLMGKVTAGDATWRGAADLLAKRSAALMKVRLQGDVLKNVAGALSRNDDEKNPATYIAWDADPNLLAVQNGVIDLRTGQLRPCKPDDYIRTVAPVEWHGLTARCPEWLAFIQHVHSEDVETVRFMQRLYGYAATGHARDHYISVLYGPNGRNGKGVELEVVGAVLGDYALAVAKNILIDTGRPQQPSAATPHLMQLRGKRFVWCSETKEGERADAGLLKYLSGEDTINARGLYESGANFTPTHTMFLATNHKPHLPADDPATWERVILIEFKRRYVEMPDPTNPNEFPQDTMLKERLRDEYPGILAWIVRGAMQWHRNGIKRPASTMRAVKNYQKGEDWAASWIDQRCNVGPEYSATSEALYDDFEAWWDRKDRMPSRAAFGRRLKDLNFEKGRDPKTTRIVRKGLALKGGASTLDSPINFEEVED